ncbi:MAG: methylmalonyl-CoA epimerase [Pseudomonadota bacterium]
MIHSIDHVGVVVKNLDEALDLYVNILGFEKSEIKTAQKGGKFRTVMVSLGKATIELIEPLDTNGGIQRFLETKGEGIHHISFQVKDIQKVIDAFENKGIKFLNEEPEKVDETLIAFMHPKSVHGVLVELVQRDNLK